MARKIQLKGKHLLSNVPLGEDVYPITKTDYVLDASGNKLTNFIENINDSIDDINAEKINISDIKDAASASAVTWEDEDKPVSARTAKVIKEYIETKLPDDVLLDNVPTANSDNAVKSGGVKTAIDNVAFSTNEKVKNVGIDDEPTAGSDNLVKSGGVKSELNQLGQYVDNPEYIKVVTDNEGRILFGIKSDGSVDWGKGVPLPISSQLELKVDKELGKGLISTDFANTIPSSLFIVSNPEYREVTIDDEGKIIEGLTTEGRKIINVGTFLNENFNLKGDFNFQGNNLKENQQKEFIEVKTDSEGVILEGFNKNGEKYIGAFDESTQKLIKNIAKDSQKETIPVFNSDFISKFPINVIGTKGDEYAQYNIQLPLSNTAFNIRFKFRITENLINKNKSSVIAKLNNVNVVSTSVSALQQRTTIATYNDATKTNYWPCLRGGLRLNNSLAYLDKDNQNLGEPAFSIKYVGNEDTATIENTGDSFILKIGDNTNTFLYTDYPTVSELYEALKNVSDIQLNCREINERYCTELVKFSECKLKSTMYTGITGEPNAPIVEYTDAAEFIVPYAVSNIWHKVEVTKINGTIYCSCDGVLTTVNTSIRDVNILSLGGTCGVLFKDFDVHCDDFNDAEIVDGTLISSMNPYIIIYEGHGIDNMPSVEDTTTGNMNSTIDRLSFVFSTLKEKGYVPVSVFDISDWYMGIVDLPKRCYTLIFDDYRFDNVLDINKRSVFTRYDVKPALAIISQNTDGTVLTHNGVTITIEEAAKIAKLHNFDLVSHTRNHRSNDAVKPSEMIYELTQDNYDGEIKGVNGEIIVFPYGAINPYLFSVMDWLGLKLGVNVDPGNLSSPDNFIRLKYNVTRQEIGMRRNISIILQGIK